MVYMHMHARLLACVHKYILGYGEATQVHLHDVILMAALLTCSFRLVSNEIYALRQL